MNIPLIDMLAQYRSIQSEIDTAIHQVLESTQFILGPNVKAFESEVASYLGVKHGVGVASGTDALILALRALNIGPGDEVIVPAYTFFATAEAVIMAGATPVFVDIDPKTYCIDVSKVAECITKRSRAVIPVHLYGHSTDMLPLMELAKVYGLKVIEDNAQAFGAEYHDRKTGSFGDIACLSFFPSKNLGGYGDGGMVVTNDDELAQRIRMLRSHGWREKYHPEMIGYNSRLDELQAAILRVKLNHVDKWNERRRRLAETYSNLLSGTDVGLPLEAPGTRHVYHLYIVRVKERKDFQEHLREQGIASAIYYPKPVHLLDPFRELGLKEGDLPISEQASRETLAIPLYPEMADEQVNRVAAALQFRRLPVAVSA